jgi:NADH-quinone oxidoreductase subunit M
VTPRDSEAGLRRGAFLFSLVPFAFSLYLLQQFDPAIATFQLVESTPWLPSLGVFYSVGVDGISLFLVLLTTFLMPIVILAAWGDVHKRIKEYMIFLLLMETGMIAHSSPSSFLFVFWRSY